MQIVAFNSSPRDNQTSKTELVLQEFLKGARRAGASVETIYLRNYKINYCLGCFHCWLKQGRCVQRDDMTEELFNRYVQADLAVLATPIYHANMNAQMKAFIERTMPMIDPFAEVGEGAVHAYRFEKVPRVVALSVCGYWEQATFQALSLNMRMIFGSDLVAEIYRHSSEALIAPELQPKVQQVLAAVAQAREEVVRHGRISQATLDVLSQDLAPREELMRLANKYFRQELEKHS